MISGESVESTYYIPSGAEFSIGGSNETTDVRSVERNSKDSHHHLGNN